MLNCTETYRSRDKKPGDNILNDSSIGVDENGNFFAQLNSIHNMEKENDYSNLNDYLNKMTIAQKNLEAYSPASIDTITASLTELSRLGKYCRSPRERGLKLQINSAELLRDNAEPSRRSRFRMRKV